MLAKGRLLGLQFLTLFEDDLYYDICRAANEQAYRIAAACREAGFSFFAESPTNQQFPIFPNRLLSRLRLRFPRRRKLPPGKPMPQVRKWE